jgi:hypothetical protein
MNQPIMKANGIRVLGGTNRRISRQGGEGGKQQASARATESNTINQSGDQSSGDDMAVTVPPRHHLYSLL